MSERRLTRTASRIFETKGTELIEGLRVSMSGGEPVGWKSGYCSVEKLALAKHE
jgi:hypothetical protein